MGTQRQGKKWEPDEDDQLFAELRGEATLTEIAEVHGRTPEAICARVARLLRAERTFNTRADAFTWARSELRTGRSGRLGWAIDRVDGAVPITSTQPPECTPGPAPARKLENDGIDRYHAILELWSAITERSLTADECSRFLARPELDVLAGFDPERLTSAGRRLWESRQRLHLASWVLESDWSGIEGLQLTASHIQNSPDDVSWTGGELLEAGLQKLRRARDCEVLMMRLGLHGDVNSLAAIGEQYGLSRERIRQLQNRGLRLATVKASTGVRRCWHQVHDVLCSALSAPGTAEIDPKQVYSFIELSVPDAPLDVAAKLVARLCGYGKCDDLVGDVVGFRNQRIERRKRALKEARTQTRLTTLNDRVQRLIDDAAWPEHLHDNSPPLRDPHPLREPAGSDGMSITGRWYSDKLGREVGYESHQELELMLLLEASPLVRSYCEQPVVIPYQVGADASSYYPDLLVTLDDGRNLLVEVKGFIDHCASWRNMAKFAAAARFAHDNGWGFVVTNNRMTWRELIDRRISPVTESRLRYRLTKGPMNWRDMGAFMSEHQLNHLDIAAIIWRNRWYWRPRPYLLSPGPPPV